MRTSGVISVPIDGEERTFPDAAELLREIARTDRRADVSRMESIRAACASGWLIHCARERLGFGSYEDVARAAHVSVPTARSRARMAAEIMDDRGRFQMDRYARWRKVHNRLKAEGRRVGATDEQGNPSVHGLQQAMGLRSIPPTRTNTNFGEYSPKSETRTEPNFGTRVPISGAEARLGYLDGLRSLSTQAPRPAQTPRTSPENRQTQTNREFETRVSNSEGFCSGSGSEEPPAASRDPHAVSAPEPVHGHNRAAGARGSQLELFEREAVQQLMSAFERLRADGDESRARELAAAVLELAGRTTAGHSV